MKCDIDNIQFHINSLENENTKNRELKIQKEKKIINKSSQLDLNKNKNNGYLDKHKTKDEANYVPYSMKDYQNIKDKKQKLSGSLGPNIGSDEWVDKKAKQIKMAEFGNQIKNINKNNVNVDAEK